MGLHLFLSHHFKDKGRFKADSGFARGWHAVFAPAAIAPAIANRLNAAFVKAAGRADIRDRIIAGGSVPIDPPLTVEQWTARFRQDVEQWGRVAKAAKVTAETQ